MTTFTVVGEVVRTISTDIGVRAENAEELRAFWSANQIDTELWKAGDVPVIFIGRAADKAACAVGDRVQLTFETVDRSNGRGIQTVDFRML